MIGTIAFVSVMLAFTVVSVLWLNGRLPEVQSENSATSKGRLLKLSFRGHGAAVEVSKDFWVPLTFMALGPSAILGLSVSYAEVAPLRVMFVFFVLPAYLIMIALGILYPKWGKRALLGFIAGVIATLMYDVARLFLVMALGLPDPIPHIGELWLGADTVQHGNLWWVGYLWRFFGNGAGMGIVYAMLPKKIFSIKSGWIYGDLVGLGMFALLFFFPTSQAHLFILNTTVLVNGIIGHWAYGLALGWIFARSKLVDKYYL